MKLFGIEFKFNGFDIWHKGNFDPASKVDKADVPTKTKLIMTVALLHQVLL